MAKPKEKNWYDARTVRCFLARYAECSPGEVSFERFNGKKWVKVKRIRAIIPNDD